eukprot:363373-Prymnesium_polylepis.1
MGGAALTKGARWLESDKCRLTDRGKERRAWYEAHATRALAEQHDEANGGDGAAIASLIPRAGRKILLYAMMPMPVDGAAVDDAAVDGMAVDDAAVDGDADDVADPDDFEFQTVEVAGEVLRQYGDAPTQDCSEGVETETACADDGEIAPSWGNCSVEEVLTYLLLERLRGHVFTSKRSRGFGVKGSCDAAVVRRARRGRKQWTTCIVQVLCTGVNDNAWGRAAVINALSKAQSPNKFAKVRVWQGKDDREN